MDQTIRDLDQGPGIMDQESRIRARDQRPEIWNKNQGSGIVDQGIRDQGIRESRNQESGSRIRESGIRGPGDQGSGIRKQASGI